MTITPTCSPTYLHDPNAIEIYEFDWSGFLEDDETLSDSEWLAHDGNPDSKVVVTTSSHTSTDAMVKLTATDATLYGQYRFTNHITDSDGESEYATLTLIIEEK